MTKRVSGMLLLWPFDCTTSVTIETILVPKILTGFVKSIRKCESLSMLC